MRARKLTPQLRNIFSSPDKSVLPFTLPETVSGNPFVQSLHNYLAGEILTQAFVGRTV